MLSILKDGLIGFLDGFSHMMDRFVLSLIDDPILCFLLLFFLLVLFLLESLMLLCLISHREDER